ncbi:MAG: GDSL-type esterase/lipase family protein [Dysgonamonadaceae bacterium]|jgi:lysophospholipase L1-like esterase|nr:GDSL-type esterase/lipase family protein [Dysgonamonadaceae bacterium]
MKIKLSALCILLSVCGAKSQSVPAFADGERIVFVGNSITCGGHYHSYIWLYYMTHFPDRRISIYNEGIGGDVANMMYLRLDKVFEHQPTLVTLSFGMNDVGYMDYTQPENGAIGSKNVAVACEDYQKIETELKKYPTINKVLIGSSPYDESARFNQTPFPGKNRLIEQIADFLQQRAKINKWHFLDFNRPMMAINQREQQADSTYTLCGADRIHPTTDGHLVMAYLFLKAQGLTGKPVADILIDASGRIVKRADNCRITDLSVSAKDIRFTYLAKALPYPIDYSHYENEKHTQADALKVIPFMDEVNCEGLAVTGLSDGYYLLKIENEPIARLTAGELKRGINLASYANTPQNKQAEQIRELNERRWLIERQIREYYWIEYNLMRKTNMLWACNEAAVDTLQKYRAIDPFVNWTADYWLRYMHKRVREDSEKEQQSLVETIYRLNKPQALKVELVKLD